MLTQTKVAHTSSDVLEQIESLGLDLEGLLEIRTIAFDAASTAGPSEPKIAAANNSRNKGVGALRDKYVGGDWYSFSENHVEGIINYKLRVIILFANVYKACGPQCPQARSTKGQASVDACQGNLFDNLAFETLGKQEKYRTFYFMLDSDGAAELSQPEIRGGRFKNCLTRIFLAQKDDLWAHIPQIETDDRPSYLEPSVSKK